MNLFLAVIQDEFIGFTLGHLKDDLNGLCVYLGPRRGRFFFDVYGKQRYLKTHEEILPAERLVFLFLK